MKQFSFVWLFLLIFHSSTWAQVNSVRIRAELQTPVRVGDVELIYQETVLASMSIYGALLWSVGFLIDDQAFSNCLDFENQKAYLSIKVLGREIPVKTFYCESIRKAS